MNALMENVSPALRVVLVGRDLSTRSIEQVLTCHGASNYICVPSIDAADWLIKDGFDADLLIVHRDLLPTAADVMRMRNANPQAIMLPTAAVCSSDAILGALKQAARMREEKQRAVVAEREGFFQGFGRRLAWG